MKLTLKDAWKSHVSFFRLYDWLIGLENQQDGQREVAGSFHALTKFWQLENDTKVNITAQLTGEINTVSFSYSKSAFFLFVLTLHHVHK